MQGWLKLHRKLLYSDIFQNEKLLKVFMYCLMKATHKEHDQKVGRRTVTLQPGQFVYGRRKAALELNMNESTVRDYIYMLRDDNVIDIKPDNKFSLITIVNWEIYQSEEEKDDNKNDNKYDKEKTAKGQQKDTNKNVKNVKNEKSSRKYIYDDTHLRLAEFFYNQILHNNPEHKKPNLEQWANDIRLMMERDERTEEQIKYLIEWVQQDDFEMTNVLSPSKLRKRFDQLVMKVKKENKQPKVSKPKYEYAVPDEIGQKMIGGN